MTELTRKERIKQHFEDHKNAYIWGGVGVLTGITLGSGAIFGKQYIGVKASQILAYKSTQNIEVFVEALGDPGNIIQDLATGIIYASQGQAARELGISKSSISRHLNGETDHAQGHKFNRLGKAGVSQV